MKFGDTLTAEVPAHFAPYAVTYKELKKAIKLILGAAENPVETVLEVTSRLGNVPALSSAIHKPPQARLNDLLDHEITKVGRLVQLEMQSLGSRCQSLRRRLADDGQPQGDARHSAEFTPTPAVSTAKDGPLLFVDDDAIGALHTNCDAQFMPEVRKLVDELEQLQKFIRLNITAFRKLLKKYDKQSRQPPCQAWFMGIVLKAPFAVADLSEISRSLSLLCALACVPPSPRREAEVVAWRQLHAVKLRAARQEALVQKKFASCVIVPSWCDPCVMARLALQLVPFGAKSQTLFELHAKDTRETWPGVNAGVTRAELYDTPQPATRDVVAAASGEVYEFGRFVEGPGKISVDALVLRNLKARKVNADGSQDAAVKRFHFSLIYFRDAAVLEKLLSALPTGYAQAQPPTFDLATQAVLQAHRELQVATPWAASVAFAVGETTADKRGEDKHDPAVAASARGGQRARAAAATSGRYIHEAAVRRRLHSNSQNFSHRLSGHGSMYRSVADERSRAESDIPADAEPAVATSNDLSQPLLAAPPVAPDAEPLVETKHGLRTTVVRVEPKTWFACERTLLDWLHVTTLIALGSLYALQNVRPGGQDCADGALGLLTCLATRLVDRLTHGPVSERAPHVLMLIALALLVNATLRYGRRQGAMRIKEASSAYVDPIGPALLTFTLCGLIVADAFTNGVAAVG